MKRKKALVWSYNAQRKELTADAGFCTICVRKRRQKSWDVWITRHYCDAGVEWSRSVHDSEHTSQDEALCRANQIYQKGDT